MLSSALWQARLPPVIPNEEKPKTRQQIPRALSTQIARASFPSFFGLASSGCSGTSLTGRMWIPDEREVDDSVSVEAYGKQSPKHRFGYRSSEVLLGREIRLASERVRRATHPHTTKHPYPATKRAQPSAARPEFRAPTAVSALSVGYAS